MKKHIRTIEVPCMHGPWYPSYKYIYSYDEDIKFLYVKSVYSGNCSHYNLSGNSIEENERIINEIKSRKADIVISLHCKGSNNAILVYSIQGKI